MCNCTLTTVKNSIIWHNTSKIIAVIYHLYELNHKIIQLCYMSWPQEKKNIQNIERHIVATDYNTTHTMLYVMY